MDIQIEREREILDLCSKMKPKSLIHLDGHGLVVVLDRASQGKNDIMDPFCVILMQQYFRNPLCANLRRANTLSKLQ